MDVGAFIFAGKNLEKHANIVGANNRRRESKVQELGHIEMAILCNVRKPVSFLCSVREFKGNRIH